MLNKDLLFEWFGILAEAHCRTLSEPTIKAYYAALQGFDDSVFRQVCQYIFENDERFPTVTRFREVRDAISPPETYRLPAHTPKAFVDMTPEEQVEFKRELERVRPRVEGVAASKSGFASLGQVLSEVKL